MMSSQSSASSTSILALYSLQLSECVQGDKLTEVTDKANDFYNQATEEADKLPTYNSPRLGLALNYSVFHYELKNDSKKACELA